MNKNGIQIVNSSLPSYDLKTNNMFLIDRWLETVCADLGGSWWWAQECPKHVERNKNTIKF
jgi:hypothetical protein